MIGKIGGPYGQTTFIGRNAGSLLHKVIPVTYPSGEKIYHWPAVGRDIVSTTAVFMDGTIIPEDFMVRVMDDLYSMRHNMLNITAKSLEYFRAHAYVDDLIRSTDSFPAGCSVPICPSGDLLQQQAECIGSHYQGQHGAEHYGYRLRVLG